jgi:hypothetical protein
MSNAEITREIDREYDIITSSSTLWRLKAEYHAERKKLKIKKEDDYSVFRVFKTKAKNPFIVRISKRRTAKIYNEFEDSETMLLTYYYTTKGIRVFTRTESGLISVFNGHLFTRYRERMNLSLTTTLEIVKRFFNNREWNYMVMPKADDKQKFIGIVREGFIPGDILVEENLLWFVHKTFISRDTAGLRLTSTSGELVDILKNNLVKAHPEDNPELYEDLVKLYQDFGLMKNDEFNENAEARMKEIVKDVRGKNMPETDFWVVQ